MRENIYHEFMDLEEVAEFLAVSMTTLYKYIHAEEDPLPSFRISRRNIKVKKADLDNWLESRRKNGGE